MILDDMDQHGTIWRSPPPHFVFVPTAALAYVDPGSAGFLITSVLGFLAACGYIIRGGRGRLKRRILHSDRKAAGRGGDGSDSTDARPKDGSAQG